MGILQLFGFSKKREETLVPENICVRCGRGIPAFSRCCILGYDNISRDGISSDESKEVICALCIDSLHFSPNAISAVGGVVPAVFSPEKETKEMQGCQNEHYENRALKRKKRRTRSLKRKRKLKK